MEHLEVVERAKYEALWAGKAYRTGRSPGAAVARQVLKALGPTIGDLIIDYGAGPGKACKIFLEYGLHPIAVDIAENSLAPELRDEIFFIQANLWNLPPMHSDWCYCTDVLEHLPMDKVETAIKGISERTLRGGYIQVATIYDRNGPLIAGKHLHLTVKPAPWWMDKVQQYFSVVKGVGHVRYPMRKWQYGMLVRK